MRELCLESLFRNEFSKLTGQIKKILFLNLDMPLFFSIRLLVSVVLSIFVLMINELF